MTPTLMNNRPNTDPDAFAHGTIYLAVRKIVRRHARFLIKPWTSFKRAVWFVRYPTAAGRFAKIHEINYWASGESRSGEGSTLEATTDVRHALERFIADYNVVSMLDVPCGDFNWMQHVDMKIPYTGGDIVEALITRNRELYGRAGRTFEIIDLTRSQLPRCALVFTRDCLNHLSIEDVTHAIANIRSTGAEYLAVTQFPEQTVNRNQESGFHYRELNFQIPPFNWPPPLAIFNETSHPGKHIAFWKISSLPTAKTGM
jgi:hypothetical protein